MSIKVMTPGLLTSIQDLGRSGYQKYGVIVSGGMDSYSLRLANMLVGNEEGEAVLEITLVGPTLLLEEDILLAITGGDLSPTINGQPIPMGRPILVKQGSVLKFGVCQSGCRAYLAVRGGYNIPEVMGSKSTYIRAGIGGYQGRALLAGDVLLIKEPQTDLPLLVSLSKKLGSHSFAFTSWYVGKFYTSQKSQEYIIRVMPSSQFEFFTSDSREHFFQQAFKITTQSDRMGYRLAGPRLQLAEPLEMVSEAVALGTIQVPPDGNPIVLLADRQTVGGYPKIAQVAAVDNAYLAQVKPGETIRFQEISLAEAEGLYVAREKEMEQLKIAIQYHLL
ncbi:biotin-dependent carboxyltransferase family protein [Pelosinus sp. UFO1]|uniref:5-oxoprolinase subunit C family protein n=1 Tax=Pelosinus sp. UFO1 TaxID=484770 RepID=UPI0004D144F7|nr:biotin-dependent carboxyltransferase family protein [Pelosinus sp. UFO1]AIF52276.1 urea amidolyase related protein [Pelosinus sp. UFO1]